MLSRGESSKIRVGQNALSRLEPATTGLQAQRSNNCATGTVIFHTAKIIIYKYVFMCILLQQCCFVMILSFLMFVTNRGHSITLKLAIIILDTFGI